MQQFDFLGRASETIGEDGYLVLTGFLTYELQNYGINHAFSHVCCKSKNTLSEIISIASSRRNRTSFLVILGVSVFWLGGFFSKESKYCPEERTSSKLRRGEDVLKSLIGTMV
jgi:hypothetical protein